jgi:hypothetical protein
VTLNLHEVIPVCSVVTVALANVVSI